MKKILLATSNPHKAEKLSWIINGYFDCLETMRDIKKQIEVDESANTFVGNAIDKAVIFSKTYDGYVIATDGGVCIPGLGEDWDPIKTKRFAGEKATDEDRIHLLLGMMSDKVGSDREMVWREAIALAKNGQCLFSTEVEGVKGVLADTYDPLKYKPGIWVCSVWYFPEIGKNFFDMSKNEQAYVEQSWHKLRRQTRKFLSRHLDASAAQLRAS